MVLAERRQQHGHRIGRLHDGRDVLFADAMEPVQAQEAAIGWNPDDRLAHGHLLIILNSCRQGRPFDGPYSLTKGDPRARRPDRYKTPKCGHI